MYQNLMIHKSKLQGPNFPQVWAISSGKGGVGKTNLAVNLAIAWQKLGYKVLLFDGDLGLANVDVLLGICPQENILQVFEGKRSLKDLLIKGPHDLLILPASSGVTKLTHLNERQKLRLLEEFEDLEEEVDIVILDTPAGISENVLYFNMASQERILVVTPEPTSITDAYALIKVLCQRYAVKNFHLVVNRAQHIGQGRQVYSQLVKVIEKFLGGVSLNLLGILPLDPVVTRAVRAQQPFLDLYPQARISQSVRLLAQELIALDGHPMDGGLKFFARKIMGVAR